MAELPNCDTLLLNLEGGVLHVTLNRPDSRNAMSLAMVGELRAVLDSVRANAEVRAIVLRGAGGHFCAGGDIKDMAGARARSQGEGGSDAYRELNRAFGAMLEEFQQAPQVVMREYVNPRTGEVAQVPEGVDPGFAYNPGMARQQALQQIVDGKLRSADPGLADAARRAGFTKDGSR